VVGGITAPLHGICNCTLLTETVQVLLLHGRFHRRFLSWQSLGGHMPAACCDEGNQMYCTESLRFK